MPHAAVMGLGFHATNHVLECAGGGRVARWSLQLTKGSHHLIVDRAAEGSQVFTEAQDCVPTMGNDATRLWLAQQPDSKLSLPDGVAFSIEAHQRIFLQLHYFNTGAKNAEVSGHVELHIRADAKPALEAKSLFSGSTDITLLPQQTSRTRFFMEPSLAGGPVRHVFAMSSHTHQLAVRR